MKSHSHDNKNNNILDNVSTRLELFVRLKEDELIGIRLQLLSANSLAAFSDDEAKLSSDSRTLLTRDNLLPPLEDATAIVSVSDELLGLSSLRLYLIGFVNMLNSGCFFIELDTDVD